MHTSEQGTLAESRVTTELLKQGYHVFTQYGGKAPIDIIALKSNKPLRISVKSTSTRNRHGTFTVALKKVRGVTKNKWRVINFDSTECDIVAIYFFELDLVAFISTDEITCKNTISFSDKPIEGSKVRLISNYLTLDDKVDKGPQPT